MENSDYTGDAMKYMPKNTWPSLMVAVLGICLLGSGQASASQDPVAGLLVRLQFTIEEPGLKTFYEFLYYRDGLVITRAVESHKAYYGRGSLSAGDLASLRRLLNETHVGLIAATPGCQIPSPTPDFASLEDGSLTWFGKNGRQNYMTVNSGGDVGCPADLLNLFLGIYDLHVSDTDVVTTVP
jgi:hypothetical protein